MRSTFIKIFLSFWLTEFLIIVATIFILARQFESTEVAYTSLYAMMESNAERSVQAYVSGGCKAMQSIPNTFPLELPGPADQPAILFDPAGKALCQQVDEKLYASAVSRIRRDGYLLGERHDAGYLEGIQARDAQGRKYAYLVRGSYPSHVYIPYREEIPRLVISLIISVLVTFGITMLITRPIGSLREAARKLAAGDLRARVPWPKGKAKRKSGDELWGLVYDFNEMADRLESLVDAQMLLLRDVSHELRSPLARLSVALELAREEAQPGINEEAHPVMLEQLDRIERETGRLNSLIGQLLSLSHLESTTRLPVRMRVSLGTVVKDLLPDMDYEAQRRNCGVSFANGSGEQPEPQSSAATEVLGSPELLARAVENIIRNAIAYTAEGTSVEIQLFSEQRLGSSFAVLQVRDQGPGVPEAALKSIFRPFYRLDLSRQRSTGGYGVGLAITERAVRLHAGTLRATNRPTGGTSILFLFPLGPRA